MEIAARRAMRKGAELLSPPAGLYDEFVARFPYDETDDQARAIDAVIDDLGSGQPMDRLICGDVGFGKTEVALRAAFVVAHGGPPGGDPRPDHAARRASTSSVMRERFAGLPLRIEQLSRFVPPKQIAQIRAGLEDGEIDIVVGTHALLATRSKFRDLGARGDRRGAAFRRGAQGAAEAAARRGARADADRDADPAHPADGAGRREGDEHHRHAAGRPAGGAHLRPARRPRGAARGDPARALPRRADLLRLPAHRGSGAS